MAWQARIAEFLAERLHLELHPHKIVLQRITQGIDFLGCVVYPHHRLIRQRTVRALRRRIAWFCHLAAPEKHPWATPPMQGEWRQWLDKNPVRSPNGEASTALLMRMLSTLNSYYGLFMHADTYTLRKHVYHHELGILRRYFLPADKDYTHLLIRAHWLRRAP